MKSLQASLVFPQDAVCSIYESPIGKLYIVADEQSLIALRFSKPETVPIASNIILEKASAFLEEYFSRKVWYPFKYIRIPYASLKVRKILLKLLRVPFGRTITYKQLYPKSPRFAGYVLSRNVLPIFIPCHRVVAKRSLGGYSAGLELKMKLLEHEGIRWM